jgi:hypothetical protein
MNVNVNKVQLTLKFISHLLILVYYEKKASALSLCYTVRVRYFTFSF